MKTRIKKVYRRNGNIEYYPQSRCFFLWFDLYEIPFLWYNDAKEAINRFIKDNERENEFEKGREIVAVEYEKYP